MRRKIFILALIVEMLCSVSTTSILTMGYAANAEDLSEVKSYEEPERYEYTQAIGVSLSFSGGKANCSGYVKPRGSEWASISVTLYKKNGTNWNIVQSWSGNATGGATAAASGSALVSQGTYKVVAFGNVGGEGVSEEKHNKRVCLISINNNKGGYGEMRMKGIWLDAWLTV